MLCSGRSTIENIIMYAMQSIKTETNIASKKNNSECNVMMGTYKQIYKKLIIVFRENSFKLDIRDL